MYIARAPDMYIRPDAQLILRYPIIFFSGFSASPPPHSYHQWNLWHTRAHEALVYVFVCVVWERARKIRHKSHASSWPLPTRRARRQWQYNILYIKNNKSDASAKKKRIFILFFDINKMYYDSPFLDFFRLRLVLWKEKNYIKVFAKRRLTKTRKRLEVFVNFSAWHGVFPFAISVNVFFTSYAFSSQKKK